MCFMSYTSTTTITMIVAILWSSYVVAEDVSVTIAEVITEVEIPVTERGCSSESIRYSSSIICRSVLNRSSSSSNCSSYSSSRRMSLAAVLVVVVQDSIIIAAATVEGAEVIAEVAVEVAGSNNNSNSSGGDVGTITLLVDT